VRSGLAAGAGAPFANFPGVSGDSGAERPTFEEVLAQIWQRWEDVGHVITDVQRAFDEVQSLHQRVDRSAAEGTADQPRPGAEAATDGGAAQAA